MKSKDLMMKNRDEIRAKLQKAVADNDSEVFANALGEMMDLIGADIKQEYESQISELQQELDQRILSARGVRQLTKEERDYYQKLTEAMRSHNPKQAVENLDVVLPRTVVDSVFEDLRHNHPLLSRINFVPSAGNVELLMNTNGYQEAAWGELCDEIVKELTAGFKAVNAGLFKLSAFLPVCKAMLDLGPEWIDRFVRETLYEALANGLEAAIVTGDGNKKPIGMNRNVGEDASVVGGVYPEKEAIPVPNLRPETVGALIAQLAVDGAGHARAVTDMLLLVNPVDYFSKVMPATTIMAPDGTYRNDVLPYPMTVIQVPALAEGTAVIGPANRYFATAGTAKEGRIEASDHAKFLEDKRVYLIKTYANGMPKDNNSFLVLDISGLKPATLRVEMVSAE